MAELTGLARAAICGTAAGEHPSTADDRRRDSGADRDHHHVVDSAPGTEPVLGQAGRRDVVAQDDR